MVELDKYKNKPKNIKIDGENVVVVVVSAQWEAYSCMKRYFDFLENRLKEPSTLLQ